MPYVSKKQARYFNLMAKKNPKKWGPLARKWNKLSKGRMPKESTDDGVQNTEYEDGEVQG